MLFLAPREHPYDFFVILRWVVLVSACVVLWVLADWRHVDEPGEGNGWEVGVVLFSAMAILFNPVFPVYMDREDWVVWDMLAAALFVVATFGIRRPDSPRGSDQS
jgi:hypothetical protein